jgi:hypothetical protein
MLTAQHVRIDACLAPVPAPLPLDLIAKRRDLLEGAYDHLSSRDLDALCRGLERSALVITAQFNDHLNSLLAQYGLHVTQVSDPADQVAVSYGGDYTMTDALQQALDMRDWFLPAARHTWVHQELEDFPRPR